ncbi:hypothetical protein GF420_07445 [candidate division GN15 bacterium]|nr:hypothetical protein [candidate division GN15 bacterium]
MEIEYSLENDPLSTVGPLRLVNELPDDFLVINGDVLTDIDLHALYDHHRNSGAIATVAAARRTEQIDFGVVELDEDGRIVGFREKPTYDFTVSMGVYVFSKRVLSMIPADRQYGFDELMRDLLDRDERIESFVYSGYWLDVGRLSDFEQAQRDVDILRELGLS